MQDKQKNRWLPTSTVAQRLGVSTKTVLKWIESGRFDMVRDIGAGTMPRYQVEACSVERFEEGIIVRL